MIRPLSVAGGGLLPLLRPSKRDIASAAAAIMLRPRACDAVAVETRRHRRRLEDTDPVARRVDTRHRDVRARDLDRERLVADHRAGFRARADPGAGTARKRDLEPGVELGAADARGRAVIGAGPVAVRSRLWRCGRDTGSGRRGRDRCSRWRRGRTVGRVGLGLVLFGLPARLLELFLLLVEARDRRRGIAQESLVLRSRQVARRRLVPRLLPGRDRLARATAEAAVGAAGGKA